MKKLLAILVIILLTILQAGCNESYSHYQPTPEAQQQKASAWQAFFNGLSQLSTTSQSYNQQATIIQPSNSSKNVIGKLSANPYALGSTSNPYGAGSTYNANSINNPYGQYGSKYSSKSANNPYATNAPKLYDSQGNYRGKLSSNPYDPDSVSNPYGKYGSPYSPDSINNPYGAGSPYRHDSPTNPYGGGLIIVGE